MGCGITVPPPLLPPGFTPVAGAETARRRSCGEGLDDQPLSSGASASSPTIIRLIRSSSACTSERSSVTRLRSTPGVLRDPARLGPGPRFDQLGLGLRLVAAAWPRPRLPPPGAAPPRPVRRRPARRPSARGRSDPPHGVGLLVQLPGSGDQRLLGVVPVLLRGRPGPARSARPTRARRWPACPPPRTRPAAAASRRVRRSRRGRRASAPACPAPRPPASPLACSVSLAEPPLAGGQLRLQLPPRSPLLADELVDQPSVVAARGQREVPRRRRRARSHEPPSAARVCAHRCPVHQPCSSASRYPSTRGTELGRGARPPAR